MRFLVTGATGFVGSHLSRRLVRDGHTVIGVSRKGPTELSADLLGSPTFQLQQADLAEYDQVTKLLQETSPIDGIFHLAAQLPGPTVTLRDMTRGNVVVTGNMLEAAHHFNISKIIVTSTMSVYGPSVSLPVTESTPTEPKEFYGLSKLQTEEISRVAASLWGLHIVCLRHCGIFGPGNNYGSICLYTARVLENKPVEVFAKGRIVKDFVSIYDVVEANLRAFAEADRFAYEVFTVGGGEPLRLADIAQLVVQAAGTGQVILTDQEAPGVTDFAYDIRKARELLDYRPAPLADRIREYVEQRREVIRLRGGH